ncbi:hypothetical protein [Acinetobacter baumannii]|uniref:hypothetical protein n=1 Tax=Acinetobacter baumannii TaxID=470 RepID=UPI00244D4571|nr:hypothetical protein [Acinetobacter baumannii]MDH2651872.1 hypothetical protein [Acinetobacter baumannii]MDO7418317.1 hypothetical protein [Acinetobacter baumannii]HCA5042165.1 hypothetical protein [Acinetobacter baumannii]
MSTTSLISVWVTNFFNNKHNLNRQKFESDQKEQERIHSMRKEIYLNASDRIIELSSMIGNLVDPVGKVDQAQKTFTDFLITMNRLRLIADIDTSEKSSRVVRAFLNVYMDVYLDAHEIIDIDNDINLNQDFFNKFTKDIDRTLDLMRVNFESDEVNLEKYKKLEASMEYFFKQRDQYHKSINDLLKKKVNLSENLALKIAHRMPSIQLEIVDLTVLLRKDIFGEDGLVKFSQDLKSEIGISSQFFEDVINKSKLNK